MSMLGAVAGVGVLRLLGFVSTVTGATVPAMLALQYVAMAVAFGFGILVIRRGLIIEPPAFINRIATLIAERASRLAPQ